MDIGDKESDTSPSAWSFISSTEVETEYCNVEMEDIDELIDAVSIKDEGMSLPSPISMTECNSQKFNNVDSSGRGLINCFFSTSPDQGCLDLAEDQDGLQTKHETIADGDIKKEPLLPSPLTPLEILAEAAPEPFKSASATGNSTKNRPSELISPEQLFNEAFGDAYQREQQQQKHRQSLFDAFEKKHTSFAVKCEQTTINLTTTSNEIDDSNSKEPPTGKGFLTRTRSFEAQICKICGDRAFGYNFNVFSCEACKAFFRRNAHHHKELKCIESHNKCQIDKDSRRSCQKCRLDKCFNLGMKKDWILNEEQRRKRKNARISTQERTEILHTHKSGEMDKRRDSNGSTVFFASNASFELNQPWSSIQQQVISANNTGKCQMDSNAKSPVNTLAHAVNQIKLSRDHKDEQPFSRQLNTSNNSSGYNSPTNCATYSQSPQQLHQVWSPLNSPSKPSANFNWANINGYEQLQQQSHSSISPNLMAFYSAQPKFYYQNLDAYRDFQLRMHNTIDSAFEEYHKPMNNEMEVEIEKSADRDGSDGNTSSVDPQDGKITLTLTETEELNKLMEAFAEMDAKMDLQKAQKYAFALTNPEATLIYNVIDELIRRLVRTFQKMEAFRRISLAGQLALFKNIISITHLLSLRAAALAASQNVLQSQVLGGTQFSLDFLDKLNDPWQKYRFRSFISVIDEKLRMDKTAMCIISTIIFFEGYKSVELEFFDRENASETYAYYKYLLKRYLASKYSTNELIYLIKNISDMIGCLEKISAATKTIFKGVVNPQRAETLVTEIFPLI